MAPFAIIFPLIVIAVIIGAIVSYQQAQARVRELTDFALTHSLQFHAEKQRRMHERFPDFELFRQGSSRHGRNFLTGTWESLSLTIFDYHYAVRSGKHTRHYRHTVVMLEPPFALKRLAIHPEGIFDRIAAAFGFEDIDFESAEFSRKFRVTAPDRRWAYDVLTPRSIEFLLQAGPVRIEMGANHLMILRNRLSEPADILADIRTGAAVLAGIPEFARTNP